MANDLLEKDGLDMVACGRTFQKNPGLGMFFLISFKVFD